MDIFWNILDPDMGIISQLVGASSNCSNVVIKLWTAIIDFTVAPGILFLSILFLSLIFFLIKMFKLPVSDFFDDFMLACYTQVTRRITLPKHRTPRKFTPSISFMGGGQLWMFAIGAGHYVYETYDTNKIKILASSSGCFAAVPLACGLDPYEWCKRDWGKCMDHFNSRTLGCLFDSKHFYYSLWNEYLPQDAHIRLSGKLFISVTLFPSMKNQVVSHFGSRDELIWTIVASICLPFAFFRDFPVRLSNGLGLCLDGGFSNDAPCLDSYSITVSALHKEADIKPPIKPVGFGSANSVAAPSVNITKSEANKIHEWGHSASRTEDDSFDYDHDIRIRLMDIIRVPEFDRVWEVAEMGNRAASRCLDFARHEWEVIRKTNLALSEEIPDIQHKQETLLLPPVNQQRYFLRQRR